jgi:hypothetical protein
MATTLLFDGTKSACLMKTAFGHLTYCTNIHAGESWAEHFGALKLHLADIKQRVCSSQPFGVGLRLSDAASKDLEEPEILQKFREWLQEVNCYVFTMNGFPYGGFHHTRVKDNVHAPDWTLEDRVNYTIRLAQILASLLPPDMEGGISTSPLTYRHWHTTNAEKQHAFRVSTHHILQVVKSLIQLEASTGKRIHLDIEPEPDGLLESGEEFLQWYNEYLLPMGIPFLAENLRYNKEEAEMKLKEHVQLCYDICHFAVGYESHEDMLRELRLQGIRTGKIQISAALKAKLVNGIEERAAVMKAFEQFNEPVYLHQVVAYTTDGVLKRYADLPDALKEVEDASLCEWRAHYHVPLFIENYGVLQSTIDTEGYSGSTASSKTAAFYLSPGNRNVYLGSITGRIKASTFRINCT